MSSTVSSSRAPRPATIRDAYRFFLPLMLTAELLMLSHAMVIAFLARMPDPAQTLAAFSISFYLHATLGSPIWACQIVAVSFIRDRGSLHRLLAFSIQVTVAVAWVWILLGATPAGDWFFRSVFGASAQVAATAKHCTLVLLLMLPFVMVRSLAYALLMVKRRTLLVTYGSLLRVLVLFILLSVLTPRYQGAVIGAVALLGCIIVETLFSLAMARPAYLALPHRDGPHPTYRRLWNFSWPIMLMQLAESSVSFTVNFFLGRLVRPELALAAFGVLDSLVRVMLSPLRNLVLTAQTMLHADGDSQVLLRFGMQIAAIFCVLLALFHVPAIEKWVLFDLMGLSADIALHVGEALLFGIVLAGCMAGACLARGFLIVQDKTHAIATASVIRLIAVVLVGIVGVAIGTENGAMLGLLALVAAFVAEGSVLSGYLLKRTR